IDEVSNDLNQVSNPFDMAYDRGSGALDRRHIFNANYVYSLRFFVKSSNKAVHAVLGGWQLSGITVAQSGAPVGGNGVGITYNHTEFNCVDTGSNDANFGHVTSTYDPRVLQLGAKFSF